MNDFETTWKKFDHVIEEMHDGMCFFEGFILNLAPEKFEAGILSLCGEPFNAALNFSIWSDDSTKDERKKSYKAEQYLEFFRTDKIILLDTEYLTIQNKFELHLKLMIEKWDNKTIAEIICYREPILTSNDPKHAVGAAIVEFIRLKELFGGSSLFIGPDTLNYPEDDQTYPTEWIKISN